MNNLFNKIELYIDNQLEGEELESFEIALQTDAALQKEVEIYRTMITAIRAKEADKLRQKFAVLDVVLDKQLEEEDRREMEENVENLRPKIVSISTRKTFLFRAAAMVLVTFAAYTLFSYFAKNSNDVSSIVFEKYEVEYSGWVEQNIPKQTETTEAYSNPDKIGENTPTKNRPSIIQSDHNTSRKNQNQEGVSFSNTPKTPSISTKSEKAFALQYEDANYHFKRKDYAKALNSLQQIEDTNLARKHFRLGMVHYFNGKDLNQATQNLTTAIEKDNLELSTYDLATAKYYLAMAYAKQGNSSAAKPYFNDLANSANDYSQKAKDVLQALK